MGIPIFVLSFNRLTALQTAIASWRQIAAPTEIVIHDAGSTYRPLLEYLHRLQASGAATVFLQRKSVMHAADLNAIAETIEQWFKRHDAPYYIVSDPDVALEPGCADIIETYAQLLAHFETAEVVGPMLRIDDIPDHYPLKRKAVERHTEQFWHKQPEIIELAGKRVAYQSAPIDTTFGMYRRGFRFHRLCRGLRTYAPYWARHLDWYIDPSNLSDDQRHYLETASNASHWGGAWLRDALAPGFRYEEYPFKV